ncbi:MULTISPECIES: hypothetical protein [Bacillus]|uniref:hypothetical protein n=1 Tax=Bacillus TaxID=1386 RepID=UPI000771D28F|nr:MULTISPECIES: hypothetical protein [Bacillus]MBW0256828.1 hypothetical protein [Bacillus sp. F2HM]MCY1095467.1 hypothetical protein [Bacillus safensis]MDI0274391.1 hypothetical protein [Bacillus safensis]MEC1410341.1 hypothetical protein [Bacillus safensis]PAK36168.1 hypothetical protein CHI04_04885 [Bacillus safensis]
MPKMKMRIEKDDDQIKYISILRKHTDKSISEIKEAINKNDFILSYNLLDIDELKEMKNIISLLEKAGAKMHIYEDSREVSVEFLDNLIESYLDTEKYLEEVDEQINED